MPNIERTTIQPDQKILTIQDLTEEEITSLTHSAQAAHDSNYESWNEKYPDQYIAIINCQVIAADYRYEQLTDKLIKLAGTFPARTLPYVTEVDDNPLRDHDNPNIASACNNLSPETAPRIRSSHVLRLGHDLRVPNAALEKKKADKIQPLTPQNLGDLIHHLKYITGYFPLTIIIDGCDDPSSIKFLECISQECESRDHVWVCSYNKTIRSKSREYVTLDMNDPNDASWQGDLNADLLFISANSTEDLANKLNKWHDRALAVAVSCPDTTPLYHTDSVALSYLRFQWQS